jgi:hypothetical protein
MAVYTGNLPTSKGCHSACSHWHWHDSASGADCAVINLMAVQGTTGTALTAEVPVVNEATYQDKHATVECPAPLHLKGSLQTWRYCRKRHPPLAQAAMVPVVLVLVPVVVWDSSSQAHLQRDPHWRWHLKHHPSEGRDGWKSVPREGMFPANPPWSSLFVVLWKGVATGMVW